jgi:hypothetical protein
MREDYKQGFYGRKLPVLFEDFDEETHMAKGHTSNYLLVSIPSEKSLHGEVVDVTYDSSVASD